MEEQGKRLLLSVGIVFALMLIWQKLFPPESVQTQSEREVAHRVEKGSAAMGDAVPEAPTKPPITLGEEQLFSFDFEKFKVEFSSYDASITSFQLKGEKFANREEKHPEDLVRLKEKKLFKIGFHNSTMALPEKTEWRGEKISDSEIRFKWEDDNLSLVKYFRMNPQSYSIEMLVDIESKSGVARQTLRLDLYSYQDVMEETGGFLSQVQREWIAACFVNGDLENVSSKDLRDEGAKNFGGQVNWAGFLHAYFLVAAIPTQVSGRRVGCNIDRAGAPGSMALSLYFPELEVEQGQPATEKITLYLGPKYLSVIEKVDKQVGPANLSKAVDLGFLAFIAGPLLAMLKWFYGFVGNWGISIILLTFVVKCATLPWVHRSMKSMQAMATLRPEMDKIKEKYKDDSQRQQLETMNLLKANNVSFFSGCLPMILQMPIWFAFYRALNVATELYQADFLWIEDLTLPDPIYVMPIAVTAMMFLQTKLTPQTATGVQQKIISVGMPLMFGVFSFVFPAGLTLYIFTNTVLTAIHHLFLHKDKRREAAELKKKKQQDSMKKGSRAAPEKSGSGQNKKNKTEAKKRK